MYNKKGDFMSYMINEELKNENGLSNYYEFTHVINDVWLYYKSYFGNTFLNRIDLFIDNGTEYCGYTPISINVLDKYVIIKLDIRPWTSDYQIAYVFCHELMHFVYYCKYGMTRIPDIKTEEVVCSASSLIYIKHKYPNNFQESNKHTKQSQNNYYAKGADLAEQLCYNFSDLVKLI